MWLFDDRLDGCDGGIVAGWHRALIALGPFHLAARLFVEELEKGLVGVAVQMVDLVSLRKQICHGGRWWLVGDCAADDVGHVSVVVVAGDVELGFGVEAANGGKMDVST